MVGPGFTNQCQSPLDRPLGTAHPLRDFVDSVAFDAKQSDGPERIVAKLIKQPLALVGKLGKHFRRGRMSGNVSHLAP